MSPVVHKAMKKGTLKNLWSQVSVPGPSGPSCILVHPCFIAVEPKHIYHLIMQKSLDCFIIVITLLKECIPNVFPMALEWCLMSVVYLIYLLAVPSQKKNKYSKHNSFKSHILKTEISYHQYNYSFFLPAKML